MDPRPDDPHGAARADDPADGAAPADDAGACLGAEAPTAQARAAGATPPVASVGDGRYRLLGQLGEGGMATVHRAEDTVLRREVAVKLLRPEWAVHPEVRERFRREALQAASLSHPHVVAVLDAGAEGDREYLVLELVEGDTLRDRLATGGTLPPSDVARLGADVAHALDHAHARGLVHRDVKPGNILLDARGARLADFGIAKSVAGADLTSTGMVMGTAAYLAPEQAAGQPVDARADQYALGCVLYEAVTGQRPFSGATVAELAAVRLSAHPRPSDVADVPPVLDAVIARALAPSPEDRYPSAGAMADALEAAAEAVLHEPAAGWSTAEAPAVGTASAGRHRPAPRRPPSPLLLLGGGSLLLLLVVALAVRGGGGGEPGAPPAAGGGSAGGDSAPLPLAAEQLTSFDPGGGGGEHDGDLPRLVDGDPTTTWETEGYSTAAFGNLKEGVGIVVDLGAPTTVAAVHLLDASPGLTVELRTADAVPTAIDATQVVARADADAESGPTVLAPPTPVTATALVVWLTGELPEDGGRFRGAIGELRVVPQA